MSRSASLVSALFIFGANAAFAVFLGTAPVALADNPPKILKPGIELFTTLALGIESGHVKPGSKVTATVLKDVRVNGAVLIPKDSKLIGRVTVATRYRPATAEGPSANAQLGLVFESAQVGAGRQVALQAIVVALAPQGSPGYAIERIGGMIGIPGAAGTTSGVGTSSRSGGMMTSQKSKGATGGRDSSGVLTSGSLGVFDLEGLDVSAQGLIVSTRTEVSLDTGTQMLLLNTGDDTEGDDSEPSDTEEKPPQ